MPPDLKSLSDLVKWLVEHHHRGNWQEMSRSLHLSQKLIYFWRDGAVRQPSDKHIDKLCEVYELDYWDVMAVILGRPRGRGRGRFLAPVVASLALLYGTTSALALPVGDASAKFVAPEAALIIIGSWRRRLRAWLSPGDAFGLLTGWATC